MRRTALASLVVVVVAACGPYASRPGTEYERTEKWTIRAWKCPGEAPAPFDLSLVVADADKERRFYSGKDWKLDVDDVRDAASLRAAIARARPALD